MFRVTVRLSNLAASKAGDLAGIYNVLYSAVHAKPDVQQFPILVFPAPFCRVHLENGGGGGIYIEGFGGQ